MLAAISMEDGHTIDEIFDADGIAQFRALHDELTETGLFEAVVTPLIALEYTDTLIQGDTPGGDPLTNFAGAFLQRGIGIEEEGSEAARIRSEESLQALQRILAIPEDERTFANPDWVKLLIFDNHEELGSPCGPSSPTPPMQ